MLSFLFTSTPLKFFIQDFWRDEAFSYLLAKKNILDIIVLSMKDFSPPFYYLLLHFWIILFGKSEIALRSLSLLFFCLTLYVVYLFLINILKINKKRACLYLLFFVINPLLNYYAFEARMYMLFTFLVTLSFYALLQKQKKLYLLSTILGLYTHYFMVFAIITQLIYIFLENNKENIRLFIKSSAIIFLSFLPALSSILLQKQINEPFWITKSSILDIINLPATIYTGFEVNQYFNPSPLIAIGLTIAAIIITGFSVLKLKDKNKFSILFLLWFLFAPILTIFISFFKPVFLPRYLIFSVIGLLFLIIYIVEHRSTRLQLFFMFILILLTLNYNQIQIKYRSKDKIESVISRIKTHMKPNDVLYVTDVLNFHTTEYYLDENRVFIYGKDYNELPQYVGKVLIPKDKVTGILPVYPKRAFILRDNFSYNIESIR